jgi:hypothetical protein
LRGTVDAVAWGNPFVESCDEEMVLRRRSPDIFALTAG